MVEPATEHSKLSAMGYRGIAIFDVQLIGLKQRPAMLGLLVEYVFLFVFALFSPLPAATIARDPSRLAEMCLRRCVYLEREIRCPRGLYHLI